MKYWTLVQIPTNWLRDGTTRDMEVIVQDLVKIAEIGLQLLMRAWPGVYTLTRRRARGML